MIHSTKNCKEEGKKVTMYSLHPTGETFCWPVVASTLTSWWPKVECGLMKCPGLAASLPRVSSSSTKMATDLKYQKLLSSKAASMPTLFKAYLKIKKRNLSLLGLEVLVDYKDQEGQEGPKRT